MTKKGFLTADEYRKIRQSLGLSLEDARDFHGVESVNTIKKWESGKSAVSEKASLKITDLAQRVAWTISQALQQAEKCPPDSEVDLILYARQNFKFCAGAEEMPPSVHWVMIRNTARLLKEKGYTVRVVEFNPQDYLSFLALKGLTDSQDARAFWATDYADRLKLN